MPDIDSEVASEALLRLTETSAARSVELNSYSDDVNHTETDEETDSNSPIIDKFFEEAGAVGIAQITNFSLHYLDAIYDIPASDMETAWHSGLVKLFAFGPKDYLFMFLTSSKHGGNCDFLGPCSKLRDPHSNGLS